MNASIHPERFHALDATRAFALMLGIVFHAAWSFTTVPMGASVMDASASLAFDWFFFASHTFRMQLFYLIAGFFAHMVCHRRGFGTFLRNRFLRIVIPLVVGWLLLYPMLMAIWNNGSNLSGRNLVETPVPVLFTLIYEKRLLLVPGESGGMFNLWHLWFLYYLLWLYVVVIGLRWLVTRSEGVARWSRTVADRGVEKIMKSPGSLAWLALGMGVFLWPMGGWFGVDTPLWSPAPAVPVLLLYGFFFALGWLLHRQSGLLRELGRRWRWQLPLGIALSILLFAAFQTIREQGLAKPIRPGLSANEVADWPEFLQQIQSASSPRQAPSELASLWNCLPPPAQESILALTPDATPLEQLGLVRTLDKLLSRPDLFGAANLPPDFKPSPANTLQTRLRNRAQLGRLFPQSLAAPPTRPGWFHPAKLVYSMSYALVLWLLLLGTLGFFQECCPGHSPVWRYVADASYWIYLTHLPLVAALQIWIAPWSWPGGLKFLLLNAVSFAFLFASYHYLVRSTVIGRHLNGRTHPFVALPSRPRKQTTGEPPAASPTSP